MSAFLNNLAAKGRGAMPRLEPRRPAPYEGLPDGPVPHSLDPMPQTGDSLSRRSVPEAAALSSPTVPFAASAWPKSAVVIPASAHCPAPTDTTLASNTLSPTSAAIAPPTVSSAVVTSATPVATPSVTRRMADAPPSAPSPPAATSLPFTQAQVPRPPANASSASAGGKERTAPVQSPEIGILSTVETLRPVIDAPQMVPMTKSQERSAPTSFERSEPVSLPLLQGEVHIPRPVAPTSAHNPGNAAPITEATVIDVHIGTIEVVAMQPQLPMTPQRVAAPPRGISLDDFLDGTNRL